MSVAAISAVTSAGAKYVRTRPLSRLNSANSVITAASTITQIRRVRERRPKNHHTSTSALSAYTPRMSP